jgi:hypothetical protein
VGHSAAKKMLKITFIFKAPKINIKNKLYFYDYHKKYVIFVDYH